MNLKQLQFFCETVVSGSAANAAKRLFVASTAISMQISALENELGAPLFERSTRPMPLTPLGQFLYPRARDLLAQASMLESDAKRLASARPGWLSIGFNRSVMLSVLPAAIRRFRTLHPKVQLELVELLSEHQPAAIAGGGIHLGIARYVGPVVSEVGVTTTMLFEEFLLVALPVGHPLSTEGAITLADLERLPFISYPRDPSANYASKVLEAAKELGTTLLVQHEAMEIHTALGLVAAGLGVTLVGASVGLQVRPDVVLRPVSGLSIKTTVAIHLPSNVGNPLVESFIETLQAAVNEAELFAVRK